MESIFKVPENVPEIYKNDVQRTLSSIAEHIEGRGRKFVFLSLSFTILFLNFMNNSLSNLTVIYFVNIVCLLL